MEKTTAGIEEEFDVSNTDQLRGQESQDPVSIKEVKFTDNVFVAVEMNSEESTPWINPLFQPHRNDETKKDY